MSRRDRQNEDEIVLSEEQMAVGTQTTESGRFRVRKAVDTETVSQTVPREVEHADTERVGASEGDSGQVETLADGSLSIPIFEEQIFVEKRMVVKERVIVRKRTVVEQQVVTAELRRERLEFETEGNVRTIDDETGTEL